MSIAQVVATRSTCPRKYVGSVLVKNRTILSTGYNGSIRGMPHCSDVGHMMEDGHCVATSTPRPTRSSRRRSNGVMIDGATTYVTASPCWNCFKQLANAGVTRICFGEFYRDERIFEVAKQIHIELSTCLAGREPAECRSKYLNIGRVRQSRCIFRGSLVEIDFAIQLGSCSRAHRHRLHRLRDRRAAFAVRRTWRLPARKRGSTRGASDGRRSRATTRRNRRCGPSRSRSRPATSGSRPRTSAKRSSSTSISPTARSTTRRSPSSTTCSAA